MARTVSRTSLIVICGLVALAVAGTEGGLRVLGPPAARAVVTRVDTAAVSSTSAVGSANGVRSAGGGSGSDEPGSGGPAGTSRRTVTVLAAGDILLHQSVWRQAMADARAAGQAGFDFGPIFSAVRPAIAAADLAICQLETPLGASDGPFTGYPVFKVPPQVATTIKSIGFDTCSTASNHTLDGGEQGVYRTLDVLDAAGIRHSGSYRDAAAQRKPNIIDVHGVAVAHLAYTFGFNGFTKPAGKTWMANLTDPAAIIAEARRARAAGAQIVAVSIHWGTEYDHDANAGQQSLARQLLAAPEIDVIFGCHAHVVQPFEEINGKWVVYGMGNEVAGHASGATATREGVMPRFTFTEVSPGNWRITAAEALATWVDSEPKVRIVELSTAMRAASGARRGVYQAAFDRIAGYLRARGADSAGLLVR